MPTLLELLQDKNLRLETVPDKFLSGMVEVQKQLLKEVIIMLSALEQDASGSFVMSKSNLDLAADIDLKLREALERSEYTEFVTEFAREFNTQIEFNDAYFKEAFNGFRPSELGKQLVANAQRNAVQLLVNTSPDAEFIMPIKQQIELAVVNNASFKDTIESLQDLVIGNSEADGKILRYAKQIAHDAFAVADSSYSAIVAEEHGAEWFRYSGSRIDTTRPFCDERKQQYFCKKEIELWGAGVNTDPSKFDWPNGGTWAGEMAGTDKKTIFSTRGGYNCRHSIMAVSIFKVPLEDVKRAIQLGYYTPTDYVRRRLGLD